jgi:peptidoglycan/LPS O-acetylase OafA/YrhL
MNDPKVQSDRRWTLLRLRRITTASHRYMAEVDGLRFIAIFLVMLFHVYYNVTHAPGKVLTPSNSDFMIWPVMQGYRGVQLFFIISGFILGLPFASQYLAGGSPVKIGKFYLRRVTRLEPPYILALLLIYAAAVLMHNVHTSEPDFRSSLPLRLVYGYFFVRQTPPTLDGVTWTLEIEVQFYLLAPLLAQVFKLGAVPRRLLLAVAICGAPSLALIVPRGEASLLGSLQYFLMGFLLADVHCTGAAGTKLSRGIYDLSALFALLLTALVPEDPTLVFFLPWIFGVVFIGALRGNLFTSVLQLPSISVIGGMCYSLYLLHNPILSFITGKVMTNGLTLATAYLRLLFLGMPFAMLAGVTYYILVERPCMNPNWPTDLLNYFSRKPRPRPNSDIVSPVSE